MELTSFWRNRSVLVTGHTGFKGSWLCLWLEHLGARVSGLALEPDQTPALYDILAPWPRQSHHLVDIRNQAGLCSLVAASAPEIVIHMAAQPLVRRSYRRPVETYDINVMGTVNLLEALRGLSSVKTILVVTTDKVYREDRSIKAFDEHDPLGGKDPYSNSKVCAEHVTAGFRDSFFAERGVAEATARSGNVIGGGDWSEDRIVPDIIRASNRSAAVELRYPEATRPWQHVLEPLWGYLCYARAMTEGRPLPAALNSGPDPDNAASVAQLADKVVSHLDRPQAWVRQAGEHPPEAPTLTLSSSLAEACLGWKPCLTLNDTIDWTCAWYRAHRDGTDMRTFSLNQLKAYESLIQ
ncbi:CDP-glucose 4,6-dehydratase (plasmid) [Peteryoungia desertarenae]|uniref:CDP-glucose 4,6-dehydratase n=1 Tax=Peteryoungia desertarenae TaxID=1813451 RepID=A0ABX6QUV1_9HYPH|nr:CDP-glucose 4,6-dehydratase [Peteryoungia desertarenae]QLF72030.1 CDP-glucose 4,6-dehydratase [Peteryoungia desertarenae]